MTTNYSKLIDPAEKKWNEINDEIRKEVSSTHSWKLTTNIHGFEYYICTKCKLKASIYIRVPLFVPLDEDVEVTDGLPVEGMNGRGISSRIAFTCEQNLARKDKSRPKIWYVYILECLFGDLYTGVSNNLYQRFWDHQGGKGAKYTRQNPPIKFVYLEEADSKVAAMRREYEIKHRLTKQEKLDLVNGFQVPPEYNMKIRR